MMRALPRACASDELRERIQAALTQLEIQRDHNADAPLSAATTLADATAASSRGAATAVGTATPTSDGPSTAGTPSTAQADRPSGVLPFVRGRRSAIGRRGASLDASAEAQLAVMPPPMWRARALLQGAAATLPAAVAACAMFMIAQAWAPSAPSSLDAVAHVDPLTVGSSVGPDASPVSQRVELGGLQDSPHEMIASYRGSPRELDGVELLSSRAYGPFDSDLPPRNIVAYRDRRTGQSFIDAQRSAPSPRGQPVTVADDLYFVTHDGRHIVLEFTHRGYVHSLQRESAGESWDRDDEATLQELIALAQQIRSAG